MALIAMVALLGVGALTLVAVRSDAATSGRERFSQVALYAAESGAAAGMAFLRQHCATDGSFFTASLDTSPEGIVGNNVPFGEEGNVFEMKDAWYSVSVLDNEEGSTIDEDGVVIVRSIGHGPDGANATIEVELQSPSCLKTFCTGEFAQKNVSAMNDTDTKTGPCAGTAVSGTGWRTAAVGAM